MRLATNPLALTIMMLLQASGRNLFQYRIELYQMVTRTLLDTWNRESGRSMFSDEEIPVAEQLLSNFAFRLHESGSLLTKYDIVITTRHTLATFHQLQPGEIRESEITQFIDKLRSSSGLFVEGGEDLYYYANPTIQDYYVVLYLLHMPQEELKQFAFQHYRSALWRESLLLALTYKSRQALLTARSPQLDGPAPREVSPTQPLTQSTPQERARNLQALQGVHRLTKLQVEELLVACIDTRPLPEATQQELSVSTVQEMAWKLLRQPFALDHEAGDAALRALESSKIPISEGAATLLQHSTALPQEIQKQATEKIWQMLIENNKPYRYSPSGNTEQLRLYDTMFETVKVLSDHS